MGRELPTGMVRYRRNPATPMCRGEGPLTTRLSRSLLLLARSLKGANPVDSLRARKA